MTPTIETAAPHLPAITAAAAAVIVARAKAAELREEIDGIKAAILATGEYVNDYTGERITAPADDWQMDDDQAPAYYEALDLLTRAAGHNPPEGQCPALIAETAQRDAEHALIEAARKIEGFEHMTTARLLCGTGKGDGLETRARYLDLLIGMACTAPRTA